MKKVLIVGAGIGGLCTAIRLLNKGYEVTIIEKENSLGGKFNLRCYDGFRFDLTASILMTPKIYIDIFKMDNVANNPLIARWQYFCGKLFLAYQLSIRTYKSASFKKQVLMLLSSPLKIRSIRQWIFNQTIKYNKKKTDYYGFFFGRTRYHNSVVKKELYGEPLYVPFEDTEFLIAERYHEYLTQMFGNYMQLPPEEQRKGLHLISVDFGKYATIEEK